MGGKFDRVGGWLLWDGGERDLDTLGERSRAGKQRPLVGKEPRILSRKY